MEQSTLFTEKFDFGFISLVSEMICESLPRIQKRKLFRNPDLCLKSGIWILRASTTLSIDDIDDILENGLPEFEEPSLPIDLECSDDDLCFLLFKRQCEMCTAGKKRICNIGFEELMKDLLKIQMDIKNIRNLLCSAVDLESGITRFFDLKSRRVMFKGTRLCFSNSLDTVILKRGSLDIPLKVTDSSFIHEASGIELEDTFSIADKLKISSIEQFITGVTFKHALEKLESSLVNVKECKLILMTNNDFVENALEVFEWIDLFDEIHIQEPRAKLIDDIVTRERSVSSETNFVVIDDKPVSVPEKVTVIKADRFNFGMDEVRILELASAIDSSESIVLFFDFDLTLTFVHMWNNLKGILSEFSLDTLKELLKINGADEDSINLLNCKDRRSAELIRNEHILKACMGTSERFEAITAMLTMLNGCK